MNIFLFLNKRLPTLFVPSVKYNIHHTRRVVQVHDKPRDRIIATCSLLQVRWIYTGRLLCGFSSGSYSVIVPLYISEIASIEIRGVLGTYFQLQFALGILYAYVAGSYASTSSRVASGDIPSVSRYRFFTFSRVCP